MQNGDQAALDLYSILEVKPDASADEIRRSYFRLAMRYHPDTHDGSDKEAVDRFIAVQHAYKVLTDAAQRDAYDSGRRRGKPAAEARLAAETSERPRPGPRSTPEQERDARRAFQHAQELLEQGDVTKALGIMKAVIKAVPDSPAYQSLFGYALAMGGDRLHAARDLCRRAVEAEPFNADFHAQLGYVYLKAGLAKTADGCFREALRWDPHHELARKHAGTDKADAGHRGGGWLRGLVKRRA